MVVLRRPKWRKFLSLKGESKDSIEFTGQNSDEISSPQTNPSSKSAPAVELNSTTKKRKRSEEEIALRKEKKLKSKSKESQEWKHLSDSHRTQLSSKSDGDENGMSKPVAEPDVTKIAPENTATSDDKSDATLLSAKAKEIAKIRRVEKLQEKQMPKLQPDRRTSLSDAKANEVLEYLDQYRSHIESGSAWKFKKKHQNWIMRHLYSFPWKSDDLVVLYLKTVQGQARKRLIEGAKEVISGTDEGDGEAMIPRAEKILQALEG